jgi:two-component system phosphate regulon sensor histidine kinase PhoR
MPLTLRLSLTYLLLTLAGMLLLGALSISLFSNYLAAQRARELAALAQLYADLLGELVSDSDEFAALADQVPQRALLPDDVIVRLFSTGGALLAATDNLGPFPSRPARALIRSPLPLPISQAAQRQYVAVAVGPDPLLGVVELSRSTAAERELLADLQGFGLRAALLASLVMALISWVVARSIAQPIGALSTHATMLAQNEGQAQGLHQLGRRSDEVGLLARSLDQLAQELRGQMLNTEAERKQLDAVLGAISEGVVAIDAQGRLIYANVAADRLLRQGAERGERRQETGERREETGAGWLDEAFVGLLADRQSGERELQWGTQILLVAVRPVELQAGDAQLPAAVVVLRDVTQLRALEMARTRLLRSVSHELRTPLTAILGTVENLRDDSSSAQQPALDLIESEAERLSRLVDELLKAPDASLLHIERRQLDLSALVDDLCRLQQGRARRAGIALHCQAEPGLPAIEGDRDRIKQVVLNLLDNALRYTPPGGTVSVEVGRAVQSDALRITVSDDGQGVEPQLAARIFERGIAGPSGGSGIGLAIVREIVGAHGGRVWLDANTEGARFMVEFPM